MNTISAGLLLYRVREARLEVLLGHPGGPFWKNRDAGAWSIPKGKVDPGEELLEAAKREFLEETGYAPPGPFEPLGSVTLKSGKLVYAWAARGEFDPAKLVSNLCEVEWPPRSGRRVSVPELDRAEWFALDEARVRINAIQAAFIDRLERLDVAQTGR